MPSNLTDADSFDVVSAPIGTDTRNAASVRAAMQTVANRTRYLFNRAEPVADFATLKAINTTSLANGTLRIVRGQGAYTLDTSSSVTEFQPYVIAPTVGPGRWIAATPHRTSRTMRIFPANNVCGFLDAWNFVGQILTANYTQFTSNPDSFCKQTFGSLVSIGLPGSGQRVFTFPLDLPDGVTITSISAYYQPKTVSTLPSLMPFISAYRLDNTADVPSLTYGGAYLISSPANGYVLDSSGSVSAYNATHAITLTPTQNNVVDRSLYTHQLAVAFANGGGAVAFDHLHYIDVAISVPDARGG